MNSLGALGQQADFGLSAVGNFEMDSTVIVDSFEVNDIEFQGYLELDYLHKALCL